MKYVLMHKDIEVATLEVDIETGNIQKVLKVLNTKHMPVGTYSVDTVDRTILNEWIGDRSLSVSRSAVRDIIRHFHVQSPKALIFLGGGFSLSDCYWFKQPVSFMTWEEGNLYNKPINNDIGDILFSHGRDLTNGSLHSSDITTNGNLKKRWIYRDGSHYLLKAGTGTEQQETFNEFIASQFMEALGIDHIPYTLEWQDDMPYSLCKRFTDQNIELVSAYYILKTLKQTGDTSIYNHYIHCCENFGLKDIATDLSKMITIDFLIANEDRHLNNFGLLRNPDTLEWIGVAPIFDCGSSFGYSFTTAKMYNTKEYQCKPFRKDPWKQLKLAESFEWLDINKLQDLSRLINDVLGQPEVEQFVDTSRKQAILKMFYNRCNDLRALIKVRKKADTLSTQQQMELTKQLFKLGISDTIAWIRSHTVEEALGILSKG